MKETSVDLDNDFQILHFLKQANSSDISWKIFSSADIHRRLIMQVASQNKNFFFFFWGFQIRKQIRVYPPLVNSLINSTKKR